MLMCMNPEGQNVNWTNLRQCFSSEVWALQGPVHLVFSGFVELRKNISNLYSDFNASRLHNYECLCFQLKHQTISPVRKLSASFICILSRRFFLLIIARVLFYYPFSLLLLLTSNCRRILAEGWCCNLCLWQCCDTVIFPCTWSHWKG